MKYDIFLMVDSFIQRQKEHGFGYSQEQCCRMFGVSRSGYCAWKARRQKLEEARAAKDMKEEKLKDMFREIVKKLCYVPGKRTFRTFLWRDHGISISVKKCRRIMDEMHLVPNRPKKDAYKNRATNDHETKAPLNIVGQNFKTGPRQVILTDITYLYYGIARSLFYLCAFKDAYTMEILGAAVSRTMDVSLVKDAYERMMRDHGSELHGPGVLLHSDQGSQYMSTTFKELLSNDGLIQSASRRGNSRDNAPMESFFGRMKCAILDLVALCSTYEAAGKLVMNYVHSYNHEIYQNGLAGLTPAEYYIYVTTGVYPCEDYYGVKPDEMMTVGDLVKKRMEEAAVKEEKRRKKYAEKKCHDRDNEDKKEDDGRLTCPPEIRTARDVTVLRRLISQHKGIQKEAAAWIEKNRESISTSEEAVSRLEKTLQKATAAQEFVKGLPEKERLDLWYSKNWDKYPQLNYRNEMDGLYRNSPLRKFHEENGELLTGRKYKKYLA